MSITISSQIEYNSSFVRGGYMRTKSRTAICLHGPVGNRRSGRIQGQNMRHIERNAPSHHDITITHTLKDHMASKGTDRAKSNTGALRMPSPAKIFGIDSRRMRRDQREWSRHLAPMLKKNLSGLGYLRDYGKKWGKVSKEQNLNSSILTDLKA